MRKRAGETGFTLIEMIIVMVIMALIAGLALAYRPTHSAALETEATVRALSGALRLARSRAIAEDRQVAVVVGPGGFSVDGGAVSVLPIDERLSAARVIFSPDGGSSGVTILLASGSRRIAVNVNWLTGRVSSRAVDG